MEGKLYKEKELTGKIIGIAMQIHRVIGPGFKESVYHEAMYIALSKEFEVENEKVFYVFFENEKVGNFRIDLIVNQRVVVELKAVCGDMPKLFQAQTISYLKASGLEVGLLLNFGNESLEFKRLGNYKEYRKH